MDVTAILALAGKLADLANQLMEAHKAGNQADFDTAWAAMRSELDTANAKWLAAGGATGAPMQLGPTT